MNSIQLTYGRKKDGSPNAIFDGLNRVVCSFPEISKSPYGGGDMRKGSPTTALTMEANARLFSAAPDLLDAVKLAEDMLSHLPDRIGGIGTGYVKERLRTAIAQAEGREG